MNDWVLRRVRSSPIPTRIEIRELVPTCPGIVKKEAAS
jgi:hypothetical protein